jgi:CubicO group peptidase (beta-lactamase class C family)
VERIEVSWYTDGVSARLTRRSFAAVGLGIAGLLSRPWRVLADEDTSDGDLDAFVHSRMDLNHVPGLSLAIVRDGKLLRATGFGFANLVSCPSGS